MHIYYNADLMKFHNLPFHRNATHYLRVLIVENLFLLHYLYLIIDDPFLDVIAKRHIVMSNLHVKDKKSITFTKIYKVLKRGR